MDFSNRINRISSILELLSKGYDLSTPSLVERFGVTKKIIQTDFKEYILPLFVDDKIYYDYSSKTYKAKNNFLTKTLFSADELSIIAILKNKSKDKYSDVDLSFKVDSLFLKFEDELTNKPYQTTSIEKIDNFKNKVSTFGDKSTSLYLSFDLFFKMAMIDSSSELNKVFVRKLFLALYVLEE